MKPKLEVSYQVEYP